ncbi:MAG: HNH endonuclease [Xanthomonadaceae bacterium]|jgi:predicted restriction endonuclease|nr:HNH endonuclease [Xanthomonadaceae bacterium]
MSRKHLIKIDWLCGSKEYIWLDESKQLKVGDYISTVEYWSDENVDVEYVAKCKSYQFDDGIYQIVLSYEREDNNHFSKHEKEEVCWGESLITIDLKNRKANNAHWTDDEDDKKYGGDAKKCSILTSLPDSDPVFEAVYRIARPEQSIWRRELLRIYGKCAITGENTWDVLDLAHITAASKGGKCSSENSLLLRTDLHRLFDRGLLKICNDGKVEIDESLSDDYKALNGKKLDKKVLSNISSSLAERNK